MKKYKEKELKNSKILFVRKIAILFMFSILLINIFAQGKKGIIYYSAEDFLTVGKIMKTAKPYHRIDTLVYTDFPARVNQRVSQSAGLAISFKTNSSTIYAKWCTNNDFSSAAMTPIAYRGLDLYIKDGDKWVYAGVARPRDKSKCTSTRIVHNMNNKEKECLLYLPLYDEMKNLSIGIEDGASISVGENPFQKRILIYGSSIAQGAAASRPGIAYPARLSRMTGLNFLNLGMGGSAKMEKEVADMIADINADAFILDCVPNSFPNEIRERTGYLVNTIRDAHPEAPIIIMQSVIRESSSFNQATSEKVKLQNQYIYEEFLKLEQNGIKNLHFITSEDFLGSDHEGSVDGTHPNDLGFDRMIQVIKPKIMEILKF